jgi:uncharacterized protein with NRDE domain
MCLIGMAYQVHPHYPLILVANRDEFYRRPTARAGWWQDYPNLLGGRDLEAGGTWMAMHRDGRWGCLTNYRDLRQPSIERAPSRGELVPQFLLGQAPAPAYLAELDAQATQYNGFNLLLGDGQGLYHYSNQERAIHRIPPGLYGLSNHLLDTPWPKVEKLRGALRSTVKSADVQADELFRLLADREVAPDEQLPDTGIDLAWERMLSAMFIEGERYGTRVSSILLVDQQGKMYFEERSFAPAGEPRIFSWNLR